MQALTIVPSVADSARLADVPEPPIADGPILARMLALGVCGTDRELVSGRYGVAPESQDALVIGHESLARVIEAPDGCGFSSGDHVVGIVRRPDPVPCASCAAGEWDMCRNGLYTERGIKGRHGFAAERIRLEPEFAVRVDPQLGLTAVLVEPASVIAKAWEQIERIGSRAAAWAPQKVLVTGAGPIGLLAAMMSVQRGLETHVFDRTSDGLKPRLVDDLGARYHTGELSSLADLKPDVVIECTGASAVVLEAIELTGPLGITCLAGVSSGGHALNLDVGLLNRTMVLENDVVFGTVNANRRHYENAAASLARADATWRSRLITRRVPLWQWRDALRREPGDVKVVIDFENR
ncbi:MAG: tdh 1 [Panacagrimonas sp.]|jgi:threonine dehydrogenase-like Zn-dependent dehydrogenase|nr:glucose 1-dehydrogenase [Panacagrimonas sp.]MCC2655682.1 tdh 1 [Panacagrimonas sp.]